MNFIKYQLYLLQLENYEIRRFWSLLIRKGYFWSNQPLRKNLVWTTKSKLVFLLAFLLITAFIISAFILKLPIYQIAILLISAFILLPIFYTLALLILLPFDAVAKNIIISRAKSTMRKNSQIKIIGVAGSYGKTTMKNVLQKVLSAKFKVSATPDSVNTPVGIARWIVKEIKNNPNILIIEMGEHYQGDIQYLCSMTIPDIAIITGINESHLERLKSIDRTIKTIFELTQNSPKGALIVLNADDQRIQNNYQKYLDDHKVIFYSLRNHNNHFDQNKLQWLFNIENVGNFEIPILGEYIIGVLEAASLVGQSLGMTAQDIKRGAFNIKPIEHRLQPIRNANDILVIDDSYNGNPDGVKEAIEVLSRFKDRPKVFLTPGLVEAGSKIEPIHVNIGRQLAKVADKVILIKNSVTPYIEKGLKEGNFAKEVIWFNSAQEAHKNLSQIIKPGDVVLFQNDWGDQYL